MSQAELLDDIVTLLRTRFFGKYRGTVADNADPTGRARLMVKVPAVLGDVAVWAMPCVPYAGDDVGFHALPEPGTGVWVEFEAGDPSFPIWTGFFWADNELPEAAPAGVKILKTGEHVLRLDDDAVRATLETSDDARIAMTGEIVASAGGSVTIASDVKAEAAGAAVTVGSSGVTCDGGGSGIVEVTRVSVSINNGAMEVT